MKKSAIALLTFAVAILTASCQKENISEQIAEYTPMTINAVANGIDIPATKTSLAFMFDVNWNESDKIYVTDGSNNNTFTLSDGAGTPKGSFTQDGEGKTFTGDVEAYYPSSMVGGEIKGNVILEWPANQENDQTIPMYCKTTLTSSGQVAQRMDFTSLGSVLRIAFTTPVSGIKLKSITIKDDETKMSGNFDVDENDKAIIDETYGTNSITLDLGDAGVDVSNKINYFNIAVPAGHYQKFSITFTATDGKQCVMTGGDININHNTVGTLSLTGKEFKAPAPEYVTIGSLQWATKNLGATTVAGSYATCAGDYYQWGSVNTLYEALDWNNWEGVGNNLSIASWKEGKSSGFQDTNREFTKTSMTNNILPDENDVVKSKVGDGWRMPTQDDFQALINACQQNFPNASGVVTVYPNNLDTATPQGGVYWLSADQNYLPEYKGVAGYLFVDKTYPNQKLFFPAAGYGYSSIGDGKAITGIGTCGHYWSSSIATASTGQARSLKFEKSTSIDINIYYPRDGVSNIRPVKDVAK